MTSRTHDAAAFASLVTVAAFYPLPQLNLLTCIAAVLACDIGALIPDLDQGGNRLWEMLPQGDKLGRWLRRVFWKHRTLTHSAIGVFGIYKFFDWLLPKFLNPQFVNPEIILAAIMIGIISHLLTDSFTEEGIPLLFPINYNFGFPPVRSWRIKTGRWFESWVVYPAIWVYVAWFVHRNEGIFLSILRSIRS